MITSISPREYQEKLHHLPIIDVRAPSEYAHAHIPGAISVPLFSDEERAIVGTIYKHGGREEAVRKGLEFVGPHVTHYIDIVKAQVVGKELVLHCARGGMRSKSIAMLLDFAGHTVHLLTGGFKAYKQFLRDRSVGFQNIVLLGGKTGSGKTAILRELAELGEQVVDLEGLACHRGSALGSLGQNVQPSQEQFILSCLSQLARFDAARPVWLEHEGTRLGEVQIPIEILTLMEHAPVIQIELSTEYRKERLMHEYGCFSAHELRPCIIKMEKRLGSQATGKILELLDQGDRGQILRLLLEHYDRSYQHSRERNKQHQFFTLELAGAAPADHARTIRDFARILPRSMPHVCAHPTP
ncbi:MAG: tRNA 2-selenouridine(34) synthase MnmH [Candidatus Dependentiae bacterium]|nr:tRNA 2-selenouridine(34) synthase MnmH [Candidatus Dependentiae bacterium]